MRDIKQEIIHFWFEETPPALWFQKNDDFDKQIRDRFSSAYKLAADGLCDGWRNTADGCLALCIVLDQFPRNMFRGHADAFATDAKALGVAKFAVARGLDQTLPVSQRRFLYLPFEHSENMADQERALSLFKSIQAEDPLGYDYAVRHYEVISGYGRFPHRNAILGRKNTPEEDEYLAQPGAGF